MININLVPNELRKKKKGAFLGGEGSKIAPEIVIGSGGGLILLLFLAHIVLLTFNISKLAIHKSLDRQWTEMQPLKQNVDVVITELRELQNKLKSIEKITTNQQSVWSKNLNVLSDSLPRGVWFRKIALGDGMFFIEGSAISRQKDEMINVHGFIANLKAHENFQKNFEEIELGSIQRRKLNNMDMADFLINIKLKEIQNEDKK